MSLQRNRYRLKNLTEHNAPNLYKNEGGTESKQEFRLECGPMPNVMVALPTVGSPLCSTPQSLADAHY